MDTRAVGIVVVRLRALALVALLGCGGLARAMHAQTSETRHARQDVLRGFWLGAGAGSGTLRTNCYACPNETITGVSGYVRFGITLAPRYRLGVEAGTWRRAEHVPALLEDRSQQLRILRLVGLLYPFPRGGFHIQVGLGVASYVAADHAIGRLTSAQVSPSAGLGYDVRLARDLKLVAHIEGLMGLPANFYINDLRMVVGRHASLFFWQAGLGLTWH